MSWIQKLYETYERAASSTNEANETALLPISHVSQKAHIQITLDGDGHFRRAEIIEKEDTLIPATEDSAGRTSGGAPHPLNDKIQYVAGDYLDFGGKKKSYFDDFGTGEESKDGYLTLLTKWNETVPNPKLKAILHYVRKRTIIRDLVEEHILCLDGQGKLLTAIGASQNEFRIFKMLSPDPKTKVKDQGNAFVRWCVEIEGVNEVRTWGDEELKRSWIEYNAQQQTSKSLCFITGTEQFGGSNHPARLRHGGDKAKLISSNDKDGYTYRGRFIDSDQACSVGYESSQKVHSALRWLIGRQAFRNKDKDGDQIIVAWEVSGKDVPFPLHNSYETFHLLEDDDSLEIQINGEVPEYRGDLGQFFARKLSAKIAGYRTNLGSSKNIVVMGLDSASKGRMAITYYRELTGSEFLERLETWHKDFAWFQNYPKGLKFCGAPSPTEIAEAAYGSRLNPKLKKMTVNRILPCIVDGIPFPSDLVRSALKRASNRVGLDRWEWEKVLGIACAIFKGEKKEGGYRMALETERDSRDYLYGRLLAVAERLEYIALKMADEERDTNAAKYMQRFSECPYTTWPLIEKALTPYKTRLRTTRTSFLVKMENLLDEIYDTFRQGEFESKTPLTGEFLLGYHCQRRVLWKKSTKISETQSPTDISKEDNGDGAQ